MKLRISKIFYYLRMWGKCLFSVNAFTACFSAFGILWLAVELATFFFPNTILYDQKTVPQVIRDSWFIFAITGFAAAIWRCRPHLSIAAKLNGRDVTVEIAIGNAFSYSGSLVVGSNTTFDTQVSKELISEDSIQGLFTKKYYSNVAQLDSEITGALSGIICKELTGTRKGKSKKYPMGQCVKVNPKNRTAYFIAIADINEHGVATSSFNNLKESLASLWVFIGERGVKDSIVAPVLGSGFSRLPQTREEIVREMIKSFLAACSEKTFTDKLTIVLHPQDVTKHKISLKKLGDFLQHQCEYTFYSNGDQQAIGTPV